MSSKILTLFCSKYTRVGEIQHISGLNTSIALAQILNPSILCVAPKMFHHYLKADCPGVTIINKERLLHHPEELAGDIVLTMYFPDKNKSTVWKRNI